MLNKEKRDRYQVEMYCIEDLVPEDHLLRKIEKAVDFKKIYELTDELYCKDNGRPNVDSVVLFKMVLIQHLYGITSLRRTHEEIKMNIGYRWFLGYSLREEIPHFSTVSRNFKHRYSSEIIDRVFEWILTEIEKAGYLSAEAVFIDGTHIKANANTRKAIKKAVPEAARIYEKQLSEEIGKDREEHNKKPLKETDNNDVNNTDNNDNDDDIDNSNNSDNNDNIGNDNGYEQEKETKVKEKRKTKEKVKEIKESTTDPESGLFHKGEHKKCFAYTAQTGCEKHGYIMGVTVNPGNVHDSVAFDGLYEELVKKYPEIEIISADAAYKTPWICKRITDDGRIMSFPYKRPMGKEGFYRPYEYVYDEYYDCVICPENEILRYSTTNREGYREYKSDAKKCANCPSRERCTESRNNQKTVARHIWSEYVDLAEDYRHTPEIRKVYEKRKETIERVFADAKENHCMRYTHYRGLSQVTKWVKLKFAAMNLKKYAIHRWNDLYTFLISRFLSRFFCSTPLNFYFI